MNRMIGWRHVAITIGLLALAACGGGGDDTPTSQRSHPASASEHAAAAPAWRLDDPAPAPWPLAIDSRVVAPAEVPEGPAPRAVTFRDGLEHPWGLAFLPDGSMLVTERPGRLRHVSADGLTLSPPIEGVPEVVAKGQGGLLDVALAPDFGPTQRLVYLTYAEPGRGENAGRSGTAVARGWLSRDHRRLLNVEVIFRQQPKVFGASQYGGRMAWRPDGTLFVTLGERSSFRDLAQDLRTHFGKVVRLHANGRVPANNPFAGRPWAQPEIFSLGHRNPQGAAVHPETGALWVAEHGPQGGDEINVVRIGRNYGWPLISYGCEYGSDPETCIVVGGATQAPGLEQPAAYWVPKSIAPSGISFYFGDKFPEWKGSLFVASLNGKPVQGMSLWRLTVRFNQVVAREALFQDLGERIRHVREGPDGWLYLLTDSPTGRIIRIER